MPMLECPQCRGRFSISDSTGADATSDNRELSLACPYCDAPISYTGSDSDTAKVTDAQEIDELRLPQSPSGTLDDGADAQNSEMSANAIPEGLSSDQLQQTQNKPLGVKFIAATMGILSFILALSLIYSLISHAPAGLPLFPAYMALTIYIVVALIMYFLYFYYELARKVTIFICLLSLFNASRTIVQIFFTAQTIPWREVIDYMIRFVFSLYFMLYLMTPGVRYAFRHRQSIKKANWKNGE